MRAPDSSSCTEVASASELSPPKEGFLFLWAVLFLFVLGEVKVPAVVAEPRGPSSRGELCQSSVVCFLFPPLVSLFCLFPVLVIIS